MRLANRARVYGQALTAISRAKGIDGSGATLERGARFLSFGVRLRNPLQLDTALNLTGPLALATNTPVVIAQREGNLILYQFQMPKVLWEFYTRADLETSLGVGLAEGRRQVDFAFDPPHAGVFGTTGSGKTETVKSMLAGLFTAYNPDELRAVIVDIKGKYTDFANVAHLGGLPIARTDEEINHIFAYVNSEIRHREQHSIFDGRRLLVVIDEAEAVVCSNVRQDISQALVKRGREVQVNGLFATQEPHKGYFGKYLFKQVLGRWVGLVDSAQTSYFITGKAGFECHKLTGKGDFVRLASGDLSDRLQVALAQKEDFDRLPRADMAPPEFEVSEPLDVGQLPDPPDERGPGRPREDVDPLKVAYYAVYGPGNVSQRIAKEQLGLGWTLHKRHREFTRELLAESLRLERIRRGR